MLVAGIYIGPTTDPPLRRLALCAMIILGGAIAGSAVWFTIVQKWFIGSFCPYCLTAHAIGLVLATLVISQAGRQFDDELRVKRTLGHRQILGFAIIGLVVSGAMAGAQVHFKPVDSYRQGEAEAILPVIDPHNAPVIGSPNGPYIVELLFDYNCPHCQHLHSMLGEAVRRYNGKVVFVLCPTPLNTECNPYIPQNVDEFKDSCELAKIALAVWVASRDAFPPFEKWMFSLDAGDRWRPRTVEAARGKAIALIGQTKFNAALSNPWIDEYLQNCIQIYGATALRGNNAVPKLVFGSHWVIPQPTDTADLMNILTNRLTLPKAGNGVVNNSGEL